MQWLPIAANSPTILRLHFSNTLLPQAGLDTQGAECAVATAHVVMNRKIPGWKMTGEILCGKGNRHLRPSVLTLLLDCLFALSFMMQRTIPRLTTEEEIVRNKHLRSSASALLSAGLFASHPSTTRDQNASAPVLLLTERKI